MFQNDVDVMLTDMEENYAKIINKRITCKSFFWHTLNALLSVPDPKFNALTEQIKDDIDSGTGLNKAMSHDNLATAARAKYNNMIASKKYSQLDPKDTKILELTKKVTAL